MQIKEFDSETDLPCLNQLLVDLAGQDADSGLTVEGLKELFGRHGWIAVQDGRCIAAAAFNLVDSATEADLTWLVVPDAPDRVRHALLEAVKARAREVGAASLLCYLPASDDANLAFMDSSWCNAETVAGYSRWAAVLKHSDAVMLGSGTRIRATDDIETLLAATRAAWDDLPGHKPATRAAVEAAAEAFGTGNQYVLLDESDMPVGLVRGFMTSDDDAYVDAPGPAPGWRRAETYANLVRHMMNQLAGSGAASAIMDSWGDPLAATEGFHSASWSQQVHLPARRILLVAVAER